MTRVSIRGRSDGRPFRFMDYIKLDDGEEFLEVKDGCRLRRIPLREFEVQLKKIRTYEMLPSHGSAHQ